MKAIKKFETPHNPLIDEKFHQLNLSTIGNVAYWLDYFSKIQEVEGSIVECGVGRGRSLMIISALNFYFDFYKVGSRKIYAYDSFEGFPEPSEEDHSLRNPRKGEWATSPSGAYKYSPEFTREILMAANIPLDKMQLEITKGFFCDTLPYHPEEPIALLNVDGDLYHSYIDTLENLYPKVAIGGIICFDDIQMEVEPDEKFPGARKAIFDFFGHDIESKLHISLGGNPYLIKE